MCVCFFFFSFCLKCSSSEKVEEDKRERCSEKFIPHSKIREQGHLRCNNEIIIGRPEKRFRKWTSCVSILSMFVYIDGWLWQLHLSHMFFSCTLLSAIFDSYAFFISSKELWFLIKCLSSFFSFLILNWIVTSFTCVLFLVLY